LSLDEKEMVRCTFLLLLWKEGDKKDCFSEGKLKVKKGKERKRKEKKGKERKRKERKGKERKGN
jgi:hypothetical protein